MCEQVEEKLESGQGKSTIRRFFARFCTPIFLEVSLLPYGSVSDASVASV